MTRRADRNKPDRRLSVDPAKPRLVAEWMLVIELPDNEVVVRIPVASQAEAIARGRRSGHSTFHVERRFVGPWIATTSELRSALLEVGKAKPTNEFDPELEAVEDDDEQATAVLAPEPGAGASNGQRGMMEP